MNNSTPSGQPAQSEPRTASRFIAARWERAVAGEFLSWRTSSGAALELMRTFAEAIAQTLPHDVECFTEPGKVASKLQLALDSCDHLTFDDPAEAQAYAGLHLLDRYGRVNQVLEYLFQVGRLPLRIRGARVLEVGAGPAPAAYAARDFYATLLRWPGLGEVKVGPLSTCDTLDRGRAWDPFLHWLSQNLIAVRGEFSKAGTLMFGRSTHELRGFDVWRRHHQSIAARADGIVRQYDQAEDWISEAAARRMAYEEGVPEPSAYDIIFLCNFLTNPSVPEEFETELRRLATSLTPGGLLIVLAGTGHIYPEILKKISALATTARLRDVSPPKPFTANEDSGSLKLIAEHVRGNVHWALDGCPAKDRSAIKKVLPKDVVDDTVPFRLPKFCALIFVRQGSNCRR